MQAISEREGAAIGQLVKGEHDGEVEQDDDHQQELDRNWVLFIVLNKKRCSERTERASGGWGRRAAG